MPKNTDIFSAYIAGVVSAMLLAFWFWKSYGEHPAP